MRSYIVRGYSEVLSLKLKLLGLELSEIYQSEGGDQIDLDRGNLDVFP